MSGAIEKAFGVAHDVVDALDRMLPTDPDAIPGEDVVQHKAAQRENRGPRPGSAYAARAAVAAHRPSAALPPPPADSTALATRRAASFRMVEATNDQGHQVWVVTDGVDYAVCNSKDFAERVRIALG